MASSGGHGGPSVRTTLTIIVVLWLIVLLAMGYIYYARNFTQYMDTVPKEAASTVSTGDFSLSSSAFAHDEMIPSVYTCDAKQVSPPLSIANPPDGTRSMVLIMEDRDIPKQLKADGTFLHWVVFDIAPDVREIGAGEVFGTLGAAGNGVAGYIGPCPPPQYEPTEHRYHFDLYALDTTLALPEGSTVTEVRSAIADHVLSHTELIGRYDRAQP